MRRAHRHHAPAFTLLEVVISIGLFIVLMATMFQFYDRALRQRDEGQQISRNAQLARVVLDRMADEIRQATANVATYGPGLTGVIDHMYGPSLALTTVVMPDKALTEQRTVQQQALVGQFDVRNIQYSIAWDYENLDSNGEPVSLGLARSETRTFLRDVVFADENEAAAAAEDAAAASKRELYAPEIKYLDYAYFDGAKWWQEWKVPTLPQMIRVTIGFVPGEPPDGEEVEIVDDDFLNRPEDFDPLPADQYSMVVRIEQADVFFGSRVTREASSFSESMGAGM